MYELIIYQFYLPIHFLMDIAILSFLLIQMQLLCGCLPMSMCFCYWWVHVWELCV